MPTSLPVEDDGTVIGTAWQTGRQYGPHGQRIAAAFLVDQSIIAFVDLDRGLEGWFAVDEAYADLITTAAEVRAETMYRYDRCDYMENCCEEDVPEPVLRRLRVMAEEVK